MEKSKEKGEQGNKQVTENLYADVKKLIYPIQHFICILKISIMEILQKGLFYRIKIVKDLEGDLKKTLNWKLN